MVLAPWVKYGFCAVSISGLVFMWGLVLFMSQVIGMHTLVATYLGACTAAQLLFIVGMGWQTDPFSYPHWLCSAQPPGFTLVAWIMSAVSVSFTISTYMTVRELKLAERGQIGRRMPNPLDWQRWMTPIIVGWPLIFFTVFTTVSLKLDAIKPVDSMTCDTIAPFWPRFLGYAGIFVPSIPAAWLAMRTLSVLSEIDRSSMRPTIVPGPSAAITTIPVSSRIDVNEKTMVPILPRRPPAAVEESESTKPDVRPPLRRSASTSFQLVLSNAHTSIPDIARTRSRSCSHERDLASLEHGPRMAARGEGSSLQSSDWRRPSSSSVHDQQLAVAIPTRKASLASPGGPSPTSTVTGCLTSGVVSLVPYAALSHSTISEAEPKQLWQRASEKRWYNKETLRRASEVGVNSDFAPSQEDLRLGRGDVAVVGWTPSDERWKGGFRSRALPTGSMATYAWRDPRSARSATESTSFRRSSPAFKQTLVFVARFQLAFFLCEVLTSLSSIYDTIRHKPSQVGTNHIALVCAIWGPCLVWAAGPRAQEALTMTQERFSLTWPWLKRWWAARRWPDLSSQ